MLWQQKKLSKLLSIKTLTSVVLALAICSPVFIWNSMHDWVSFDFQWKHGMASKYWKWNLPLEYLGTQILIIFPTFLLFLFQKNGQWKTHWLLHFVSFPFAFFLYSSFNGRVEANWVIMALPAVYGLSLIFSTDRMITYGKKTVYLWSVLFCMALGVIHFKDTLPPNKIKLFEGDKFKSIVEMIKTKPEQNYYAFSYQLASLLSFKSKKLVCKLPGYGRPDHFQFIDKCDSYKNGFIYITEANDNRNWEADFPGMKVTKTSPIDSLFKLVEIRPL